MNEMVCLISSKAVKNRPLFIFTAEKIPQRGSTEVT
jgi:hypothetical protein